MKEKLIEMAREAGIIEGFNDVHPSIERFYELAVAEERKKYDALLDEYERLANIHMLALNQNHSHAGIAASGAVFDFQDRLADAIEDLPFGDTAASFATFVREFK